MKKKPTKQRVATPRPAEIRVARANSGLTQAQAGALVYRSARAWQDAELGARNLDLAAWELFLLFTWQHPLYELRRAGTGVLARPAGGVVDGAEPDEDAPSC